MKSTKGFTLIEGVLILLIVGILGGTGWYVWNTRNKTEANLNNAANSTNTVPVQKTDKSVASSNKYVAVIQSDGTIKNELPSDIAKTDDQKKVLDTVHKSCVAPATHVVVNYQIFQTNASNLYFQDGNYATINTSCAQAASTVDELGGSGQRHYLHKDISGTWVIDVKTQMGEPPCKDVDGKGYPLSIVQTCYDDQSSSDRAPH